MGYHIRDDFRVPQGEDDIERVGCQSNLCARSMLAHDSSPPFPLIHLTQWIFFLFGMLYGFNTYFHAAKVYIESYHTVPKGHCRVVVRMMALFFFSGWTMYPLLFALGPEGLGVMNGYQSTITSTIADIMTKQLWGLLGHHLRVKVMSYMILDRIRLLDVESESCNLQISKSAYSVERILICYCRFSSTFSSTATFARPPSSLLQARRLRSRSLSRRRMRTPSSTAPPSLLIASLSSTWARTSGRR